MLGCASVQFGIVYGEESLTCLLWMLRGQFGMHGLCKRPACNCMLWGICDECNVPSSEPRMVHCSGRACICMHFPASESRSRNSFVSGQRARDGPLFRTGMHLHVFSS